MMVSASAAMTAPAANASGSDTTRRIAVREERCADDHRQRQQHRAHRPQPEDPPGRTALLPHRCGTDQRLRQVRDEDRRQQGAPARSFRQRDAQREILGNTIEDDRGQQRESRGSASGRRTGRVDLRPRIRELRAATVFVSGLRVDPGCAHRSSSALRTVNTAAPTKRPIAASQMPRRS